MAILRGELAVAEAVAHRELGDRELALAELRELAAAPAETMLYCRVLAMLELTQAHLDADDLTAAHDEFRQARESSRPSRSVPTAKAGSPVSAPSSRCARATRRREGWAERIHDPFWYPISLARIHLANADRASALGRLGRSRAALRPPPRRAWPARATRSTTAARAASATPPPSWPQERPHANRRRGRTERLRPRGTGRLAAPVEWLDRVRRPPSSAATAPSAAIATGLEPLTERERDVLRFLPSRLTIREIADELYISTNTLKFHLKVIYRKLGVTSRADAADAARKMTHIRPTPPCSRRPAPPTSCSPSRPDRRCGAWCRPGSRVDARD